MWNLSLLWIISVRMIDLAVSINYINWLKDWKNIVLFTDQLANRPVKTTSVKVFIWKIHT